MAEERQKAAVGDWVKCIYGGNYYDQFHGGGLYLITNIYYDHETLRYSFAMDDAGSCTNGWVASYFVVHTPMLEGAQEYEDILAAQEIMEG